MSEPTVYEIVLRGNAGTRLLRPLVDDFTIDDTEPGITRLIGTICDPSQLLGVLIHLVSINADLVSMGPFAVDAPGRRRDRERGG